VANYGGNQVLVYNEELNGTNVTGLTLVASITAGIQGPTRLALGFSNQLFVTNTSGNTVTVYDLSIPSNITSNSIPQITADTISTPDPLGVAADDAGYVYVANNSGSSISIFGPAAYPAVGFTQIGTPLTQDGAGNPFTLPGGLQFTTTPTQVSPTYENRYLLVGTGTMSSELLIYSLPFNVSTPGFSATSTPIAILGTDTTCTTNPSGPTGLALFTPQQVSVSALAVSPTLYVANYYSQVVDAYPFSTLVGGNSPP
jgi:hypothetical protein